jgi:hypothetical protein
MVAAIAYFIRLYVTLLVEPELNPLKHFPVVTVMHKLTLPLVPELLLWVEKPFSLLGPIVGGALAGLTVFLLPSLSGFLVWELKANYRLYRAARAEHVPPAQLGPHGETMQGLLVAGLHSGTLPKLYRRLRRAAQRHHERSVSRRAALHRESGREGDSLAGFRKGLRGVQRGLQRFAERELLAVLNATVRWRISGLALDRVDLSSNRIRVRFSCEGHRDDPCELTIEQLGDKIVASISAPGFVAHLDDEHRILFENALAVFYQRAQVQLVREQLEAELGSLAHYDIADEGLVVWPSQATSWKSCTASMPTDPRRSNRSLSAAEPPWCSTHAGYCFPTSRSLGRLGRGSGAHTRTRPSPYGGCSWGHPCSRRNSPPNLSRSDDQEIVNDSVFARRLSGFCGLVRVWPAATAALQRVLAGGGFC